jgi:hypothetical protein
MPTLRIEDGTYPNGKQYRTLYSGKLRVGIYDIVDKGFLPQGCRKVLGVERDAQFKVIQRYVAEHIGLAARAAELYEQI